MREVEVSDWSRRVPEAKPRTPMVDRLIADLSGNDGLARHRARQALVELGRPAVAPLGSILLHPNSETRWHAVKALCEIADRSAAPLLVEALEDENSGVRWLAASGLSGLGCDAVEPLLQALKCRPRSRWLRAGADRVLHLWKGHGQAECVKPLLEALRGSVDATAVPWEPRPAWEMLPS